MRPLSSEGIHRVIETVHWGERPSDKIRIASYYGMRVASGLLRRDHDILAGMYPKYWIGDVRASTPLGKFLCRARTIDFDIVNPNYEAIEVEVFRDRLLRTRPQDTVCLDVGAQIGKFSVLAGHTLRRSGHVFAFEPEPSNFAALQHNLELNGLRNVQAFNIACGAVDGGGTLNLSTTNIGAHTLRNVEGAERIAVQIRALDRFLGEHGVDHVDVAKLDVEYMEADVLRGARGILEASPRASVLFEETRPPGTADSVRLLRGLGYGVTHLAGNIYVADRLSE